MTYAALSFGGIGPWSGQVAETDEVYLWRAMLNSMDVRNIQDAQAIAGAIGANQDRGFDLRGIALQRTGDGYEVDAAFTTKVPRIWLIPGEVDEPSDIARKVQVALGPRFPKLHITGARFEAIDDDSPKHPALDFWRYQPIIYEAQFFGSMVPTQAFASFQGLYRGKAEQGPTLKKWPKEEPFKPPNGGNGNGNGNGNTSSTVALVLLAAGATVAAYFIYQRTSKQGAAT